VIGGYLVLDRSNAGVVLSVDARFHTTIASISSLPHTTAAPAVGGMPP
jgi:hypothetical protein